MVESGSIPFDRAAEIYDRTRAISDAAMARTLELLSRELSGRGRVLEVGVGTGLIALPLAALGLPVIGVDLSEPMLRKLVQKTGGRLPFALVRGDATRMPFRDGSIGGAYLRWVLHLIPDWRGALAEIVRVVRPGGVLLADLGIYGGPRDEIRDRFAELTGLRVDPVGLGWAAFDELDAAMASLGALVRVLPRVREETAESLGEFLDAIEANVYSWTWSVPDRLRRRAVTDLRPWVEERFGPLEELHTHQAATGWRAYDLG